VSPDNAATTELVVIQETDAETAPVIDLYEAMSERELLIALHRRFDRVEAIADELQVSVAPIMEKISGNPMLKMFLK